MDIGFNGKRYGGVCPSCHKETSFNTGHIPCLGSAEGKVEVCQNCGFVILSEKMPQAFKTAYLRHTDVNGRLFNFAERDTGVIL